MNTTSTIPRSSTQTKWIIQMKRIVLWLARHWLLTANILIGIWVGLPWLAPVFMHWGWTGTAKIIYFIYSFQCHQLPQRSFFLFGRQAMYSLSEIQSVWQDTANPILLRQFIGNPEMGWKVAWSDRMFGMYTSIWLGGLLYGLVWRRLKPISIWVFALFTLPMAVDGATHMVSDFAGIGHGFRDTNIWLQALTRNMFSQSFYAGDVFGSFNSWMRLITGMLFGLALVWFAYPHINESFDDTASRSEATLAKATD